MSQQNRIAREIVHNHILQLPDMVATSAWGEVSYFLNPDRRLRRGAYVATIKDHDGENDRASTLDRPGVWRLNMGVSTSAYFERFGPPPPRPGKGGVIDGDWDFKALSRLTPHPVYGWMCWVAILTPTKSTWERECIPLLRDARARASERLARRGRLSC